MPGGWVGTARIARRIGIGRSVSIASTGDGPRQARIHARDNPTMVPVKTGTRVVWCGPVRSPRGPLDERRISAAEGLRGAVHVAAGVHRHDLEASRCPTTHRS